MHDVVVIGTGPAGSLAALRLAEAGARVLILEKARLPRVKACGGALTAGPVHAALGWDFDAQIEARAGSSRALLRGGRGVDVPHGSDALLVDRRRFDVHILERALASGAELRDGFAVARVEEEAGEVAAIGKTGERCRGRFLVAADGATGPSARCLGLGRRTRPGVALDAEIEVDPACFEAEASRMTFNFGEPRKGYGWTFPKAGYLSCGVGSWSGDEALPPALDAWLARAFPKGAIRAQRRRGHPIPLYEGPARLGTKRALLVGDAASLVDPILGEGIRYALESGGIAAQALLARLRGAEDDGSAYTRSIHAAIGAELDRLRRFIVPIFEQSPDYFHRSFWEQPRSYSALARSLDLRSGGGAKSPAAIARSAQS